MLYKVYTRLHVCVNDETFSRMFWSEHGTPSRIWQANMDLTNKIPLQNEHATFVDPISALPPLLMIVLTCT